MINRLKSWLLDFLSPYYRMFNLKSLTPEERKFLGSSEHDEFKKVLFRGMTQKMNQNIDMLVKGQYRTDEERGNFQGAIRALGDIIEMTSRVKESKKQEGYEDIMKKIAKDLEDDTFDSNR